MSLLTWSGQKIVELFTFMSPGSVRLPLHWYRPLSRRLDRCDRVIHNESGDPNGGNMWVIFSTWQQLRKTWHCRIPRCLYLMPYECRWFENILCNTDILSFADMYDTLRLAGNKYFFGISKSEYMSKNCVLFGNVFFVSHVINRRRAPIAKSPVFFLFVSTLSIYM